MQSTGDSCQFCSCLITQFMASDWLFVIPLELLYTPYNCMNIWIDVVRENGTLHFPFIVSKVVRYSLSVERWNMARTSLMYTDISRPGAPVSCDRGGR